jgi:hypothetical protein
MQFVFRAAGSEGRQPEVHKLADPGLTATRALR